MTAPAVREAPTDFLTTLAEAGIITPTAMVVPGDLPIEDYTAIGHALGRMADATRWWIGDWLNAGEAMYGELAAQASEALNLSEQTRISYGWVARAVPPERRRLGVSWSGHRAVARLEAEQQEELLERALEEAMTSRELEALTKEALAAVNGGEIPRGRAAVVEAVFDAARDVVHQASGDGNGSFLVPPEPLVRLRAALGEGE